jgi:hypothetical protein
VFELDDDDDDTDAAAASTSTSAAGGSEASDDDNIVSNVSRTVGSVRRALSIKTSEVFNSVDMPI